MSRILGRRFALTTTNFKYLDIGISVGSISYVEILIGDNRGNYIILPYGMWRMFIERRMDIEQFLQSSVPSSLRIQDLVIDIIKIRNENIVKLALNDTCMYMKPSTIIFIFELEHCVEQAYFNLNQNTDAASNKFKHFVDYLRRNCIMNKDDAIKILRNVYDKTSLIECELIAYATDHIVHDAFHN